MNRDQLEDEISSECLVIRGHICSFQQYIENHIQPLAKTISEAIEKQNQQQTVPVQ